MPGIGGLTGVERFRCKICGASSAMQAMQQFVYLPPCITGMHLSEMKVLVPLLPLILPEPECEPLWLHPLEVPIPM